MALSALLLVQAVLFFVVTRHAFFVAEDYVNFQLAQERHLLHYLATPLLGVYPAPGHRLVTFLLQEAFPLNYVIARSFFLLLLAATTILSSQLVRTLAKSDEWWTVPLLAPFALSITLVSPVWWWSNGLPVFPALFFTAIALAAWMKSYTDEWRKFWVAVTAVAVAAAGAFYMKFLLIPIYLLFFRLVILPPLLDLKVGVRTLWEEKMRWLAVAVPPAAFVAVFVLSGLSDRAVTTGERPYLDYLTTAWFEVVVPVSLLNAPVEPTTPTPLFWILVVSGQALFWIVVALTWKRSALAARGWLLFLVVFVANIAIVGVARLAQFGVEIAYWLRYYPEVVFFLPFALALGLRQGAERSRAVAWEKMGLGRTAIVVLACVYAVSFVVWAPPLVNESHGPLARSWFENLLEDIGQLAEDETPIRIVDSETPEYVMVDWMAPRNRISRVLGLLELDIAFNDLAEPAYLVLEDGRLAEARFQPISPLVTAGAPEPGVRFGDVSRRPREVCLADGTPLVYEPDGAVDGDRLAIRIFYSDKRNLPLVLEVETPDPDHPVRRLELLSFDNPAELVDLGATAIRSLSLEASAGDVVCVERIDIGSLGR